MSKPPSETRVLLLILGVIGLMSCGCLCVPLGLLGLGLGLPAAVQVQKAANRAAAQQQARAAAEPQPPIFEPQPLPEVPVEFQPLVPADLPRFTPPQFTPPQFTPPQITPPPAAMPPIPPEFGGPPIPPMPPAPRNAASASGPAALNEARKRSIHHAATIHRSILESIEKQRAHAQQSGRTTDFYDRMLERTKTQLNEQLDRLCKSNKLTRAELEQIIAEGDQQGWSGRPAAKK